MEPYLRDKDQVFYLTDMKPQYGHCILFQKNGQDIVHRYLGETLFKGDNVKRFDQEIPPMSELTISGVITHRLVGHKACHLREGLMVRFLSFCSIYNHANNRLFHRVYAFLVKGLGRLLRRMEEVL